jgi:hypothetical protein
MGIPGLPEKDDFPKAMEGGTRELTIDQMWR